MQVQGAAAGRAVQPSHGAAAILGPLVGSSRAAAAYQELPAGAHMQPLPSVHLLLGSVS